MSSESQATTVLPSSMSQPQMSWGQAQQPMQKAVDTKTIIYKSDVMAQLMKMIERVSPSQANILVLGESGTGKELIARAVHEKSTRKNKPFCCHQLWSFA